MAGDDKYTLASIGKQLTQHIAQEIEIRDKVGSLYQTVVVGNGKPSLKHEVGRHSDWINGANRFIWLIVSALIGQFIVTFCSFSIMIFILLVQDGLLKP